MVEQSNTQKVLKGVSTQTLITILSSVIEIVAFSIMSRLLSKEDFGYYAVITAVSSIFFAFSDAGIGSSVVQKKNLDQKFLNNAFTLCLIFGLFGSSLLLVCSGPVSRLVADETMKVPLMLTSITLLTGTISSVNFSIMHRKLQFLRMGIIRISVLLFTTIVSIILAIEGLGYYAILAKVILYSIITLFASYIAAHTRYHLYFDINVYKEIFKFSGWLQASSIFRRIAEQIDRLMMSYLFSLNILGMYSRPKEFINSMTGRLCDIFDSSLFPVLSSIQDNNQRIIKSYISALYYLNIVGLMITFAFLFNSELIIRIFLGVEWMNVNSLFMVLSLSGVCMINGSLGDIFLRSLAFTKMQFFLRILQTVVSIIFILVAAHWGLLAVAIAYLLAYCIVILVKIGYISKKINFSLMNTLMVIVRSFKISFVYVPAYILCYYSIPNTIVGNIITMTVFIIITIIVFLISPICVGIKYREEVYNKVLLLINSKISVFQRILIKK